jgi:hypothetical protein
MFLRSHFHIFVEVGLVTELLIRLLLSDIVDFAQHRRPRVEHVCLGIPPRF